MSSSGIDRSAANESSKNEGAGNMGLEEGQNLGSILQVLFLRFST